MTFVDTSALYAVLDRDDANHPAARQTWERLIRSSEPLLTHNYVLVETAALVQNRLGIAALRAFQDRCIPVLQIHWLTEAEHATAMEMTLAADRRRLSLVDCASFLTMRSHAISDVFCFDKHFAEQGFKPI
jgi:predicted nucleic acid-binding protein